MKFILISVLAISLVGCSSNDYWVKDGFTSEAFNRDIAGCRILARQVGAQVAASSKPSGGITTHRGTYDAYSGTYTGTSYTNTIDVSGLQGALASNSSRSDCMYSKGYRLETRAAKKSITDYCAQDIGTCTEAVLFYRACLKYEEQYSWRTDVLSRRYVEEAKSRDIKCPRLNRVES